MSDPNLLQVNKKNYFMAYRALKESPLDQKGTTMHKKGKKGSYLGINAQSSMDPEEGK